MSERMLCNKWEETCKNVKLSGFIFHRRETIDFDISLRHDELVMLLQVVLKGRITVMGTYFWNIRKWLEAGISGGICTYFWTENHKGYINFSTAFWGLLGPKKDMALVI